VVVVVVEVVSVIVVGAITVYSNTTGVLEVIAGGITDLPWIDRLKVPYVDGGQSGHGVVSSAGVVSGDGVTSDGVVSGDGVTSGVIEGGSGVSLLSVSDVSSSQGGHVVDVLVVEVVVEDKEGVSQH
jgi:hypothetical protein